MNGQIITCRLRRSSVGRVLIQYVWKEARNLSVWAAELTSQSASFISLKSLLVCYYMGLKLARLHFTSASCQICKSGAVRYSESETSVRLRLLLNGLSTQSDQTKF